MHSPIKVIVNSELENHIASYPYMNNEINFMNFRSFTFTIIEKKKKKKEEGIL